MSSVDNRVVNMEFNNRNFASKIADTITSLQKLEDSLQFEKGKSGIAGVERAANNIDFSGMEMGIENIKNRFSTFGIVGMTVIQNLTNGVMGFVRQLGSKVVSGGITRAMNIEQARFMIEGLGKSWDKLYKDMDYAVDQTAYGIDSAAKAAAQLSASGITAGKDMRTALRGISGLAAMTGSSYDDIADVFTKVAGQGRLMGDDLLRLSSRGMNAAADLAKAMNKSEKEIRDMVSKGKISFEEFAKVMDEKYGEHAKEANRTFTGSLSNVNAALSRLGQAFITPLIETKKLDDSTYNLINVLNTFRLIINRIKTQLEDWGIIDKTIEKGGKTVVVVGKFTKAVQKASEIVTKFLDILAGETTDSEGTKSVWFKTEMLREALKMSDENFQNLKDTVNGVFSVFKILGNLFSSLLKAIFPMKDAVADTGSGLLAITGAIGRYITGIEEAINDSKIFEKIFSGIGSVIKVAAGAISYFAKKIKGVFSSIGGGKSGFFDSFTTFINTLSQKLKPLGGIAKNVFGTIKTVLDGIFDSINKAVSGADFNKLFQLLNLGIGGGIGFSLVTFLNNLNKSWATFLDSLTGAKFAVKPIDSLFSSLKFSLGEFQKTMKADTLMKIAKAIGILALSLVALSLIKPERLTMSLMAMQAIIADTVAILVAFSKYTTNWKMFKTGEIAEALVKISAALLIMSAAVKVLSTMSLEELATGLVGIGFLLLEIGIFTTSVSGLKGGAVKKAAKAMLTMSAALYIISYAVKQLGSLDPEQLAKGLVGIGVVLAEMAAFIYLTSGIKVGAKSAVGLLALSAALLIIGQAVKQLGSLNPEQLAKGLTGLGFVLLELAAFIKLTSGAKGILKASAGMYILAKAIGILTKSLSKLGNFNEEQLAKGLLGLGGSLIIIAGAMRLMPANMLTASAGLFIAAEAITTIASAMGSMGGMSEEQMAKSLVEMAGALGILAVALMAMNHSIAGAAAILVAAGALAILAPTLKLLGEMSVMQLATALVALAGAFALLGVAGVILGPLAPAIMMVSAAIALFGVGMLSAGAGMIMFISALQLLATNISALVAAIPVFVQGIVDCSAQIGAAGASLILALLNGIANKIGDIIVAAANIIANFLYGIAEKLPDIIDAGITLAVNFINGIATGIDEHGEELRAAISHLMGSITIFWIETLQSILKSLGPWTNGMVKGLEGTKDKVKDFFGDGEVAKESKKGMKDAADAVNKESKDASNAADKNLAKIPKSAKKSAKETKGAYKGIDKPIIKEFKSIGKGADLSKNMPKMGKEMIDAYQKSIEKNADPKYGKNAGKKIENGLDSVDYSAAANNGFLGFKNEWLSKDWYGLGATAADKKNRGYEEHDDQHSPSRIWAKFALNDYLGYFNSMKHLLSKFSAAGGMMADAIHEPFEEAVRTISLDSIDSSPTIRPVLDLSNVKMGVDSINSMFGNSPYALSLAGNMNITSHYDDLQEQNRMQSKNMDKLVSAIADNGLDPDLVYAAVREGAADATLRLNLNGRELSRGLKDLGVKFR